MKTYVILSALAALACAIPSERLSRASFYRMKRATDDTNGSGSEDDPTTVIRGEEICHVPKAARIPCGHQGNTSHEYCTNIGCCWDPVVRRNDVPQCYVNSVETTYFEWDVYESPSNASDELCAPEKGEDLRLDDFSKDGSPDVLCRHPTNSNHNTTINFYHEEGGYMFPHPDNFEGLSDFCKGDGDRFFTADVNNDKQADAVCVKKNGGVEARASFFPNDVEPPIEFTPDTFSDEFFQFCTGDGAEIYIGDFDGNALPDLLCQCKGCKGQRRTLAKGDGTGGYLAPIKDPNFNEFCAGSEDKMMVADFDWDMRDDLICQMPGGKYQIGLTDGDGLLVNEDWSEKHGWCSQDQDKFFVGYFNDDGRADLMCHLANKTICLRYNSHIYRNSDMFEKTFCTSEKWCQSGEIKVADYNGDELDDIYCVEKDGKFNVSITKIIAAKVEFVDIDYPYHTDRNAMVKFCDNRDLHVLDANGDSKQDLLCHDPKAGHIELVYGDTYGHPKMSHILQDATLQYCHRNNYYPEYLTLLTTDLNADGLTDLVCHSSVDGSVTSIRSEKGYANAYKKRPWDKRLTDLGTGLTFCQGPGKTVHTADLDGDSQGDLVCRCQGSGTLYFLQSQGDEFSTHLSKHDSFCAGIDSQILIGNFNLDDRQDIMCQNRSSGSATFLFSSNVFGKFENNTYHSSASFCGGIAYRGGNVHVGDYNGDKLFDVMCHYPNGSVTIRYNLGLDEDMNMIEFGDEWSHSVPICEGLGRKLEVYDANGDDLWDMTCAYSSGHVFIAEGHIMEGDKFVVSNVTSAIPTLPSTNSRGNGGQGGGEGGGYMKQEGASK